MRATFSQSVQAKPNQQPHLGTEADRVALRLFQVVCNATRPQDTFVLLEFNDLGYFPDLTQRPQTKSRKIVVHFPSFGWPCKAPIHIESTI